MKSIFNSRYQRRIQSLLALVVVLLCVARSSQAQTCVSAPANIVSWWSAEGNALDNLGLNNGYAVNAPSFPPGEVGHAFSFNGSSQYIHITNSPSLQFSTALTVEAWIYPTAYNPQSSAILCKYDAAPMINQSSFSFAMAADGLGAILISMDGIGNGGIVVTTASTCPLNTWTHLGATYDGNNLTIYFNGNAENSTPLNGSIYPGTDDLAIGANVGGVGDGNQQGCFAGLIDEPAIYNRALGADEIQAIYSAGSAGKCPLPPSILTGPSGLTVAVNLPATFSVVATGSQPLSYQWSLNGTNINNATSPTLVLPSVQLAQAGTYTITVSNAAGNPATSQANLTVIPPPPCDPAPSGIVSWWSGESNALDNLGLNNGIPVGSPTYANGLDGLAFNFDGSGQFIRVPNSPSLQFSNGMTLEAWVFPTSYNFSSDSSILCKYQAPFGFSSGSSWSFFINGDGRGGILANNNQGSAIVYSSDMCPLNNWTHLAATYDGANLNIYFNGSLEASSPMTGNIVSGSYDLGIGANVGGVSDGQAAALFAGMIDEPAIFNRALSGTEISAIYAASASGFCPISPSFTSQPTNQTQPSGGQAVFNAVAAGSQPITYQWYFNRTNIISGATNATLTLTNLNVNEDGNYSLSLSNAAAGPVFSSNATLTVLPPPACDAAPSGIVSWWSGQSNAFDNIGGNDGMLINSPGFANGKVGLAFSFDGSSQFVRVPDAPNLHLSNGMTLEAWVYPTTYNNQSSAILCKYDAPNSPGGQASWSFDVNYDGRAVVLANTNANNSSTIVFSTSVCPITNWTHLAVTYDGAALKMYFNGALQGSVPMTGTIFAGTDAVGIGANIGGVSDDQAASLFGGLIDEPAIYSRALSATEILAIYNAGISGKCPVSLPPFFYAQPATQKVFPGGTANFYAGAGGSPSLSYQWHFNSSIITNATNRSFTVTNVSTGIAGNYSVLVSNPISTTLSTNATLEVLLVTVYGNGQPLTNSQYVFTNSVTVQMTNFYPNGVTFYTLDGSPPTAGSTLYSAPFAITNNSIIQTRGYSPDFLQTSVSDPIHIALPPTYSLTATTPGGGIVVLSPSGSNYLSNTVVTVTATPSNGWSFLEWIGDLGGTNLSNSLTMDRNKSIQAIFGTAVGNAVGGNGSIVFDPPGGIYPFGTVIQAIAVPQSGNFFVLWNDSVSGNVNPLPFTVTNTNSVIAALFTTLGVGESTLTVVPVGHGTVAINPQANSYGNGTSITITATPVVGKSFLGWSGSASGTNNPLTIQLNQSETIYANFTTNHSLVIYPVTRPGTVDGMAVDLIGEPGTHYRLDAATNLSTWTTLYNLTNNVGTLHYIDSSATNFGHRFYRAVILP